MATGYVLYNLKAGNLEDLEDIKALEIYWKEPLKFIDITRIKDYGVFLRGLEKDDYIILAGGDGTINHFVNDTEGIDYRGEILYIPCGTGNDFAHEFGRSQFDEPFAITEYLRELPCVIVNSRKHNFINGVGYGIDGYCCEVGDELRKIPGKKINYTSIAIKGLLFHYKPTNAKISVDGRSYTYKNVWLAPTMYGKFYGGGMNPTPNQSRTNQSKMLSVMVLHDLGKLKTLKMFPSIFKGEHVKYRNEVDIHSGHRITVEYDRPTPLQIDGETISNVTSYTALSPVYLKMKQAESTADFRKVIL